MCFFSLWLSWLCWCLVLPCVVSCCTWRSGKDTRNLVPCNFLSLHILLQVDSMLSFFSPLCFLCSSFIFCFLVVVMVVHRAPLHVTSCCIGKIKRDTNMSPSLKNFLAFIFYFKWMPHLALFPFSVFLFMSIVYYGYHGYVGAPQCNVSCCTRKNKDVTKSVAPHKFFKLFLDFVFCFNWAPCISTLPLFVVMFGLHLWFLNLLSWSCIVHFFCCTRKNNKDVKNFTLEHFSIFKLYFLLQVNTMPNCLSLFFYN